MTLNVSKNRLRVIENLFELKELSTLTISHNELSTVEDIAHLRACPSITCLDLQENKLEDPGVLDVLVDMPGLAVLYLQGNPCVKRIRHYRKMVIGRLPGLKYLDDRPVFPEERSRCNVWYSVFLKEGETAAAAAERLEITRLADEKKAEEDRNFHAFAEFSRRAAARDPHAFQAFLPDGGSGGGGGVISSAEVPTAAGGTCPAVETLDEEEDKVDEELERYRKLCEDEEDEEEDTELEGEEEEEEEGKERELDDGVGRYALGGEGGLREVQNAVSAAAISHGAPADHPSESSTLVPKAPPSGFTDVESLE